MRESRLHLAALLGLLIAFAGPVALLTQSTGPRPCLARFARIEPGMSRGQVVAVVGARPGLLIPREPDGLGVRSWEWWVGSDGQCVVGFDAGGRVCYRRAIPYPPRPTKWRQFRDRVRPPSADPAQQKRSRPRSPVPAGAWSQLGLTRKPLTE